MDTIVKVGDEAVEELYSEYGGSLFIKRVPRKLLLQFKELAKEEFANDYGFLLKWCWDMSFGILPVGNELIISKLEELENRLNKLEETKEKPKIRMSINGTPLGGIEK